MTDGLLENIITLEKEIQADVAEEEARARTWQERELVKLDHLLNKAEARENERRQQEIAKQEAIMQHDAAEIKTAAKAWCKRLKELDDAALSEVLKEKLATILPRGDHDHPHGQG